MRRVKTYKKNKLNTMNKLLFVVFFCVIICSLFLVNIYSKKVSDDAVDLINQKLNKVVYQFFTDLITNDIITSDNVENILEINKNSKDEIVSVNYNLEKTYKILTDVSIILKDGLSDLENGKIDVLIYDKYLDNSKNGLVFNIPLFLSSKNIFINNIGPKIPVIVNFNKSLLTNIKTNVKEYGFNNALLEIYITVEMQGLIITPVSKEEEKFNYDILVAAMVVNGSVPEFYGNNLESNSSILDIPLN